MSTAPVTSLRSAPVPEKRAVLACATTSALLASAVTTAAPGVWSMISHSAHVLINNTSISLPIIHSSSESVSWLRQWPTTAASRALAGVRNLVLYTVRAAKSRRSSQRFRALPAREPRLRRQNEERQLNSQLAHSAPRGRLRNFTGSVNSVTILMINRCIFSIDNTRKLRICSYKMIVEIVWNILLYRLWDLYTRVGICTNKQLLHYMYYSVIGLKINHESASFKQIAVIKKKQTSERFQIKVMCTLKRTATINNFLLKKNSWYYYIVNTNITYRWTRLTDIVTQQSESIRPTQGLGSLIY